MVSHGEIWIMFQFSVIFFSGVLHDLLLFSVLTNITVFRENEI